MIGIGKSRRGTIPARAGETLKFPLEIRIARDHPRSRGGDDPERPESGPGQGPSPLARGRLGVPPMPACNPGTIPARAGETKGKKGWDAGGRDHPRSRGGDNDPGLWFVINGGPSPLARGRRAGGGRHHWHAGTIPARAGETFKYVLDNRSPGDHPRSRGGDDPCRRRAQSTSGPSPLARGRQTRVFFSQTFLGTIPARAGETRPRRAGRARCWDHPRSRGGDPEDPNSDWTAKGPSPLARGRPARPRAE